MTDSAWKPVRSYVSDGHKVNVYHVGHNIIEILADDPEREQEVLRGQLSRMEERQRLKPEDLSPISNPDKYAFAIGLNDDGQPLNPEEEDKPRPR